MSKNNLKAAAYISFGLFILMLAGSVYYWKERMFFADASHIAFSTINEQALQIQQYRFGAFITQIIPVLGAKLGLPLRAILMAYSASFHLFYLFVAAVLMFGFKAYRLVILYALYWVLVTTHTFFWPNNEVHQGIAYMFLLLPLIINSGEKKRSFNIPLLSLLVLGTTAIFCHPLVLPPLIFLWVYFIIEKKNWQYNKQQTIVLTTVLLAIAITKLYVSNVYATYDKGMLTGVSDMSFRDVFGVFSSPFAHDFYEHAMINYRLLPLLFIVGLISLVYKKQYVLAIWSLGCSLVMFALLCLTFDTYMEFISESEIMPLVIIMATPFVFVTLASMRRQIAAVLILAVFVLRTYMFIDKAPHFPLRVQELSDVIAKAKNEGLTKVVLVRDKQTPIEWRWMVEWGTAAESMILSGANWDKPVIQVVMMSREELEKRLPENNTDVIGCFKTFPIETVNTKYFPFDTTRPYTVINYEDFMKK